MEEGDRELKTFNIDRDRKYIIPFIKDAQKINPELNEGDNLETEIVPRNFGRIAAQSARQMITQKIREESREIIFDEFKDKKNEFKYVLAIDIPDERSFMHLDTVMTQVDVDKFAVQDAIMDISTIYEITAGRGGEIEIVEIHQILQKVLEKYLHLAKVELIKCGNGKRIDAEREQWSDGVNLICVRPGVVIAYDRNFVTNQALRRHGVKVIEVPSSELSRGRGGSHCMTMALVREEA